MKKKTTAILIILMFLAFGCMPIPFTQIDDTPIEAVVVHKMTKNEAYLKSMMWFNSNFNNTKYVINYQDKEEGIIIGKYVVLYNPISEDASAQIYSVVEVTINDNIAKIKIKTDFYNLSTIYRTNGNINKIKKSNYELKYSFIGNF